MLGKLNVGGFTEKGDKYNKVLRKHLIKEKYKHLIKTDNDENYYCEFESEKHFGFFLTKEFLYGKPIYTDEKDKCFKYYKSKKWIKKETYSSERNTVRMELNKYIGCNIYEIEDMEYYSQW